MKKVKLTPTKVKELLRDMGITPRESLGQNFLIEEGIAQKIIKESAVTKKDTVIEVGPGLGILTQEIVPVVDAYIGIEKDPKLFEYVKNTYQEKNTKFINEDVLQYGKNNKIVKPPRYHVIANLPYSISSHFINVFLTRIAVRPTTMTIMLQKEVGEKLMSAPGKMTKLSVLAQTYTIPKKLFTVKPDAFYPKPKIESVVMQLTIKKELGNIFPHYEKEFWQVVRIGFSAKRKMLINNLKNGLVGSACDAQFLKKTFQKVGLEENIRAQDVSVELWIKLVDKIVKNH